MILSRRLLGPGLQCVGASCPGLSCRQPTVSTQSTYSLLASVSPWVCVDLEIEPDAGGLVEAGVLYQLDDGQPVSRTFKAGQLGDLLALLRQLSARGALLIGHNLRRHDLPWLVKRVPELGQHRCCVDTVEVMPLAFPAVRSYRLEKAYRDPSTDPLISKKRRNHPALDCRETCNLLESILEWFNAIEDPARANAYRALFGHGDAFGEGYRRLFGSPEPESTPVSAFESALEGAVCATAMSRLRAEPLTESRARCLAYLLSLIPPEPDGKPLPPRPWVRYSHPEVLTLLRELRGTKCGQCSYCLERFDLLAQLGKLFNFEGEPSWRNEGQRVITEMVMQGQDVIGVLPTSGGKSLAFQLPAFINANATGALTLVISPLRALMDDQVEQLCRDHNRDDVVQISGKLNSLERTQNLRAVRAAQPVQDDGEKTAPAHIVYMAPEQLRSISVVRALASRGIGQLVIDEAHCMAKWGKDFRVDYRFIPSLISRICEEHSLPRPPILCLTATARREVLEEIRDRFRAGMGVELEIKDFGHARENLEFECVTFSEGDADSKFQELVDLITPVYAADQAALVFCSTRKRTEDLVARLRNEGFDSTAYYHGKRTREDRESIQDAFLGGDLKLVVATNAFGMGVDKKDIRLVVHYDVPGSIENYIQEAGRAGRDGKPARCVLFYDPGDLDIQLDLRRINQLRRPELKRIILTVRHRYKQAKKQGEEFPEVVISARDLLKSRISMKDLIGQDAGDGADDTEVPVANVDDEEQSLHQKVTTALGILEEGNHLRRHENVFQFVPVPFRVPVWNRIERLIAESSFNERMKRILLALATILFDKSSARDEKGSVDLEVMADQLNVERDKVKDYIDHLRGMGICDLGNEYVIDWSRHIQDSSAEKLEKHLELTGFLLKRLDESDISYGSTDEDQIINLDQIRSGSKSTGNGGYCSNLELARDLHWLADRGLFEIVSRRRGQWTVRWKGDLSRAKGDLARVSHCCRTILEHLDLAQERSGNVTSKFNYSKFQRWQSSKPSLLSEPLTELECEQALLFMHRREVITVVDGFSVLRARMKLVPEPRRIMSDYSPAYRDYEAYTKTTIAQIKAMERFARKLATDKSEAMAFLDDYFKMPWDEFSAKHFSSRERRNLHHPIRDEHFHKTFDPLTKEQMKAVKAGTNANHLIIAGPGSGKTHVLVLRIFYLVKVRQVPARSIAVLAYNRHAAIELRRRLKVLLPTDWHDVGVHTFHGLALRLLGGDRLRELQAESENSPEAKGKEFDQLLGELAETLRSHQEDNEDAQIKWLDRLGGIEYLLVDEFQDISEKEYAIVRLLARLDLSNRAGAVHVMAVGDDDQNIYEFRDASVKWIRQFKKDFGVQRHIFLPDNFRSVQGIIETSSRFISRNRNRLKGTSWVQRVAETKANWAAEQVRTDPDEGKVVRLKVADPAAARFAIASEIETMRRHFPDMTSGDVCIAYQTNAEAHLSRLLFERLGVRSRVLGERRVAPRYELGTIEVIQELEQLDPDESNISYRQLESLINDIFVKRGIHESWRQSWASFFDEAMMDISPETEISVRAMLWRIDEHLFGRSGYSVPTDAIANLTLHGTKGLQFHTVFLFPPVFSSSNDEIEQLRRLYFVGLSRAKVKAYLLDWPGCESGLWDEIAESAGGWVVTREPIEGPARRPSKQDRELADGFRWFDTSRRGLGTGMQIFFVADQDAIGKLQRDQVIAARPGITQSGKQKLELWTDKHCVGMLKHAAVTVLSEEVGGDWDRIIRVEVAQILQTETPEENRQYNEGKESHYYVVPRIFFRKPTGH